MNRLVLAAVLGGAMLLANCGMLDPYPTAPRPVPPAAKLGAGPPPMTPAANAKRVGICYNSLMTSLPEAQSQAQQECPANTTAEPADTDWYMQNCPVLLPARGTFACIPKK